MKSKINWETVEGFFAIVLFAHSPLPPSDTTTMALPQKFLILLFHDLHGPSEVNLCCQNRTICKHRKKYTGEHPAPDYYMSVFQ